MVTRIPFCLRQVFRSKTQLNKTCDKKEAQMLPTAKDFTASLIYRTQFWNGFDLIQLRVKLYFSDPSIEDQVRG